VVPVGTPGSVIECRSVLDNTDPNCVLYNPRALALAGVVNYLNVFGVCGPTSNRSRTSITAVGGYGVQFPWSQDGVGVNLGANTARRS
jgi:hypothetical protein